MRLLPLFGLTLALASLGASAQDLAAPALGVPRRRADLALAPARPSAPPSKPAEAAPAPPAPPPPQPAAEDAGAKGEDADAVKELKALRKAYAGPWILGSDLFTGPWSFRQSPGASVSDEYRLGAGDEMTLYVFGSATLEVPLTVDRTGTLAIPKVGSARVGGLRLGDARRVLARMVNTLYGGSRVDLQFSKTRDVRIFILGEVYRPGSYLVPSLTSLLNALALSGGPSPTGSYRSLQLLREGSVVQTLDLYALRLKGHGMESVLLRDGDTLFVPMQGTQVRLEGAFTRVASAPVVKDAPGVLVELKAGETAWDAVQFIGGLLPSASQSLLSLRRTRAGGTVDVENLLLDSEHLKARGLFPGDVLGAFARAEWKENQVEVAGHVQVPGTFAFRPGLTLADLLAEPAQVRPDTYLERGQIIRTRGDGSTELLSFNVGLALARDPRHNLGLEPRDKVELVQVEALRLKRTVKIRGPFTTPGTFDWHDHMRASDLLFQAGIPELRADRYYAELAHLSPHGEPSAVLKLDLSRLLYGEAHAPAGLDQLDVNPLLRPYDQITLYELPDFKVHRTVTISGQVRRPGPYVITEKHFTLHQLLERAGGLTEEAMIKGGIFLRDSLREKDLTEGQLKKAGVQGTDPTGNGINEILARLSETKRAKDTGELLASPVLHGLANGSTTRMVVDFQAALKGDARRDVEMLDGDLVVIPRQADSAYVVGEVASPFATFRVQRGDAVKDLIRLAGGFTRNADQGEVRLLKADGRILDRGTLYEAVEPGDAVLVPQRFRVNSTWQDTLSSLTPMALVLNAIAR
jgi:protein involved in polysaccharide export with SLBB domain